MSSINKPSILNLSGFKSIKYIFADEIDSIPRQSDGVINDSDIVLKTGSAWYDLYFTPGTLKGKVSQKQTSAGNLYEITINLSIPRESASNSNAIDLLSRRPVVLKALDNNGINKLYGNNNEKLIAEFDVNRDGLPGGQNGYEITITGKMTNYPPDIVTA